MTPEERAEAAIEASLARSRRIISLVDRNGSRARRALTEMLFEADQDLAKRLRSEAVKMGGGALRFTGASAEAYRAQIQLVMQYVEQRILGLTDAQATRAIQASALNTTRLLSTLDRQFTGLVRPLRLQTAAVRDGLISRTRSSLLAQHATSVDRYGAAMIMRYEQVMRAGTLTGLSQSDLVGALTGHGGPRGRVSLAAKLLDNGTVLRLREADIPEGLFVRSRYWAERVVRTETAHAYQATGINAMYEARNTDFPDMQKKILAILDNRVAPDSIAVHGQIRGLDEYFTDGAGRQYLRPPARPNDRETVIPWRPVWSETKTSRPRQSAEVDAAINKSLPGGAKARRRTAAQRAEDRKAVARRAAEARQAQRALGRADRVDGPASQS